VPTPRPSACGLSLGAAARAKLSPYQLFGRLSPHSCSDSLYFGTTRLSGVCAPLFRKYPGFLSTADGGAYHSEWWQVVTSDGFTPAFHVLYKFKESMTLAQRFRTAASRGVALDFEVWDAAAGQLLRVYKDAVYRGATGAFGCRDPMGTTSAIEFGFSEQGWCWGAGQSKGCASPNPSIASVDFGVAVPNSDDSACPFVYRDSVKTASAKVASFLFFLPSGAPPTGAPTGFYCPKSGPTGFALSALLFAVGLGALLAGAVARVRRGEAVREEELRQALAMQSSRPLLLSGEQRVRLVENEVAAARASAAASAPAPETAAAGPAVKSEAEQVKGGGESLVLKVA